MIYATVPIMPVIGVVVAASCQPLSVTPICMEFAPTSVSPTDLTVAQVLEAMGI